MNSTQPVNHSRSRYLHRVIDGGGFITVSLMEEYKDYLYALDDGMNTKLYDLTALIWSAENGGSSLAFWDTQTGQRIIGRMFLGVMHYDIITVEGMRRIGFNSSKAVFLDPSKEKK